MVYYAVANGRQPGIYENWEDCREQVLHYSHANFKKFSTLREAQKYLMNNSSYDYYDDFEIDDDGYVNVYTDGACINNGSRYAQGGIGVWFADNHPLNVSEPIIGRATNNKAEIKAVTRATEVACEAGIKRLKINTDSRFLINCITKWIDPWKRNGWRTYDGRPVINRYELIEMEEALDMLHVVWSHIRGHNGNYGNEQADKLAREGINKA
ncbi:ribonuclease H1-like [Prorops nasuta]|uniref:ribonuclease H1-like n=1 Tax=Prorops nasuta TaxID=863751 RepID=UPI0034CEF96B